ncbi:hypothetical protein [Streptomyces sp. NPDC004286]|uniref:hypothetical protein n=1 Tax=Streptomyces sp. NPDC004286 TaxID=3364696 RepID=UPI003694CB39
MRIIASTWTSRDESLSGDVAQRIEDDVRAAPRERVSKALSLYGETDTELTVRHYEDPDGAERWATVHDTASGAEVTDFGTQAEAEGHYESQVRESQSGDTPAWSESDVSGVPLIPIEYTVAFRREGIWDRPVSYSARLGRALEGGELLEVVEGAEGVIAAAEADTQNQMNRLYAEWQESGADTVPPGEPAEAVRVRVTGTAATGPYQGDAELGLVCPHLFPA